MLRVARAVVFPAHGPPVRHILVIGYLLCDRTLEWSRDSSFMRLVIELDPGLMSTKLELLLMTPSAFANSSLAPPTFPLD